VDYFGGNSIAGESSAIISEAQTSTISSYVQWEYGGAVPITSTYDGGSVPIVAVATSIDTEILGVQFPICHLIGGREHNATTLLSTVGGRGPISIGGLTEAYPRQNPAGIMEV
jgi:hypothetical protein